MAKRALVRPERPRQRLVDDNDKRSVGTIPVVDQPPFNQLCAESSQVVAGASSTGDGSGSWWAGAVGGIGARLSIGSGASWLSIGADAWRDVTGTGTGTVSSSVSHAFDSTMSMLSSSGGRSRTRAPLIGSRT